jgi:large subunit ribosomal protein L7/L12
MLNKDDLVKAVEAMTVLELNELVETLKVKFNVTGNIMVAATDGKDGASGEKEEKTSFNVVLKEIGSSKISVIKEVKVILGVGLKEAKDFVEKPGQPLKEGLNKEDAEAMKAKLESAGAVIELQ